MWKKVNSRQKRKKTGIFKSLFLIVGFWFLTVEGLSAAELAEILERGQLIVGVKDNLRPLGFRDEEGNLQGLEIDIARKLAEELLGDRQGVILQPVTNAERLNAAIAQDVDLTIAHVGVNSSRSRLVNLSRYYYFDSTGFITREVGINSRIDLKHRQVAVLERSSTIAIVRHAIPEVQLVGVKSYQEALGLLEAGEIAAFAGDRSLLTGWVQEYPQYRLLRDRLGGIPLAVVVPKGLQYSELYLYVNDAIARWQDSGWLQDRINYWGLGNFPEDEENGQ